MDEIKLCVWWLGAVWKCVFHAFLPPQLEKAWTGDVHYFKAGLVSGGYYPYGLSQAYMGHMRLNLKALVSLMRPWKLSEEDRRFHGLLRDEKWVCDRAFKALKRLYSRNNWAYGKIFEISPQLVPGGGEIETPEG